MGADIISVVEYSFYGEDIETASFENVRSVVCGELFMPRCPEIHHALGLRKLLDFMPEPLIPLRGFPRNLSRETVETQCGILSENSVADVRNRTGHSQIWVLDSAEYKELLPYHGNSEVYKLPNKDDYFGHLKRDEEVVMGLGTFCPSWMYPNEIIKAVDHCGLNTEVRGNDDSSLAHFGSIVAWMETLEQIYGEKAVRFVFWFDQVPDNLIGL